MATSGPFISPIFPHSYGYAYGEVDTANTDFAGGGTIVELLDPTALGFDRGVMVRKIRVKAMETTTSGQIQLYLSDDAGTTYFPWKSITVDAITPAAATATFEAQLDDQNDEELAGGLMIPPGYSLGASIYQAEDTSIFVEYGIL